MIILFIAVAKMIVGEPSLYVGSHFANHPIVYPNYDGDCYITRLFFISELLSIRLFRL